MSIAAFAVKKKTITYFTTFLLVVGGLDAYRQLGQLEDPTFTVKTATIDTYYPGASPEEVELEVTDRIETKIQEMKELKWIESMSRHGFSQVKVEIQATFWRDDLNQVWDHLRKKLREVETQLPPGASRPEIADDFGDVFGFQLAVVGDGFDHRQLERYAKDLRKELSLVKGVARVNLWGVQDKIIYLDVKETQLAQLGLSDDSIIETLEQQNLVVDAGSVDLDSKRFRIAPTGQFKTPQDIGDLVVRPSALDTAQNQRTRSAAWSGDQLIRINDIGTIRRGYREPSANIMTYNGQPAIGISITARSGVNIVEVGQQIDQALDENEPLFPVGIEAIKIYWQSDIVDTSVKDFLLSFAEAVGIVLVVLTLAMGWRMGVIIGSALVVTVLGSFLVMSIMDIDLHRISLGALIIALGMMVDNAIVVAEGMVTRMQKGMDRVEAAIEAASQPAWPLMGATLVAVMAFFPIYASNQSTGEYCEALFIVVGLSLMVSWIVSITFTPLQCIAMLKTPKPIAEGEDLYGGKFYGAFRKFLQSAIRFRLITVAALTALLVVSFIGFEKVEQQFFPYSSMTKYMIDYWAPEGTRIEKVAADLAVIEEKLLQDERVEGVASFIGSGPPRFYLPVEPEEPNPAYGQLIINVKTTPTQEGEEVYDASDIPELINEYDSWMQERFPDALIQPRPYIVGVGKTWKFEYRLSGPAVADPAELRELGEKYLAVLEASPYTASARIDWNQKVQRVEPQYNSERGRWAAVTRDNVAQTTKRAFDGRDVGLYREGDDLIPIVLRHVPEERQDIDNFESLQIKPTLSTETLPLAQVVDDIETAWEDPVIRRRDRRRNVKIQANPRLDVTMPTLYADVIDAMMAIELPPGYKLEPGGEIEEEQDSNDDLEPGIIPAVTIMIFILVAQFNAFRPAILMFLTIPFVLIGITAALLGLNIPFGFMSLLGAMSLAGMMIKNAIVLLDQVEIELAEGKSRYDAMVDSAVMRLRPVLLAAGTTVLGIMPLLQDVFWQSMAVTIMGGLTAGTGLTMILLPVLYTMFYRLPSSPPEEGEPVKAEPQTA